MHLVGREIFRRERYFVSVALEPQWLPFRKKVTNELFYPSLRWFVSRFFNCRRRALHLRSEVQLMRASANHWGWYGVLEVLIPTVLFRS